MVPIEKMIGRLSNKMFLTASHYAYCKENGIPFFVQDEKYFKKYEADIRQMYGEGITSCGIDKVSIHVRRSKNPINPDEPAYSENKFYVDLGHHLHTDIKENYYMRAMAMFPTDQFLVFSDDIEWCKQSALFIGCEFSDWDEIGDMNKMASCKSNIIANSSFSWWAAYLNPNPDKIVVAPKQWFASEENEKLIGIPDSWIRI